MKTNLCVQIFIPLDQTQHGPSRVIVNMRYRETDSISSIATYPVFLRLSVLRLPDRDAEPFPLDGLIWLQDLLLLEEGDASIWRHWCKLKLCHCHIVMTER